MNISAMEANFTRPTEDKPSLLTHNEVIEFYLTIFTHLQHTTLPTCRTG